MTMSHKEALDKALDAYDAALNGRSGMEAAIREFCEAKGLVMVPKEPTPEIVEEGDYLLVDTDAERFASSSVYRAMLAAAPDPFGDAP